MLAWIAGFLAAPQAAHATTYFKFDPPPTDQIFNAGTAVNLSLPVVSTNINSCSQDPTHNTYSLSPALPAGLSFNSNYQSLLVSGTPTTAMAQTEYTYRAENSVCYSTASTTFNITVLRTLTASAVDPTTATLTLSGQSAAWYYKYTVPTGDTSCTEVSAGTTKDLTGLTEKTSYTYKAYSDSTCTAANELASVTFTTPAKLAASSITQTTATLTISGHSGAWSHKQTLPEDPAATCTTVSSETTATLTALKAGTSYTWKTYSDSSCETEYASVTFTTASAPTSGPSNPPPAFSPEATGAPGSAGPKNTRIYAELTPMQPLTEGESLTIPLPVVADGEGVTYTVALFAVETDDDTASEATGTTLNSSSAKPQSADKTTQYVPLDPKVYGVTCTFNKTEHTLSCNVESGNPPARLVVVLTATGKGGSTSIAFPIDITLVNNRPKFENKKEADQIAKEGKLFSYTAPKATDPDNADLLYTASVEVNGQWVALGEPGTPDWLQFNGNASDGPTFRGEPGRNDARQTHTIQLKATDRPPGDPEAESATTTFRLRVETLYNSRLPQVAKQWLARFGRTVSSQVTEAVTGRMASSDTSGDNVVLNGQSLKLFGAVADPMDASGASGTHATNGVSGVNSVNGGDLRVFDPLARLLPGTREQLDETPVSSSPTTRELLTGSAFRLSLNSSRTQVASSGSGNGGNTAGGELMSGGKDIKSASGAASGGGWMVWGEAAFTNFDSTVEDVRVDGEVLTGVAAIDWQRDRWLAGLALSQSQGEGTFSAPRTDRDDAIQGTVKSSLTAVHPYVRYRPSAGLEFWGVAGYGRGTMTLDADDEAAANPDIWLTTIGIGGRSALFTAEQTGGLELDLTADALLTRTGAAADVRLRDAVEASTTRVRVGVESTWPWQNADGTSLIPILSSALRYDTGDAETGLGVEVGAGVTYANPRLGLTLSADVRGLLSRQAGDGGLGLSEWGGSGSARYDRGGDGLGLTASLSPSWGVAGSAKDQLWSEIAPPFPTAQGDSTADASGNTASNSTASNEAMRLEGEIGYGFAAFSGNAVVTPYAGLSLADGSRDWRLGGRLSFSPGLAISIEGTRKEQQNAAPDHGVQLDINTTW